LHTSSDHHAQATPNLVVSQDTYPILEPIREVLESDESVVIGRLALDSQRNARIRFLVMNDAEGHWSVPMILPAQRGGCNSVIMREVARSSTFLDRLPAECLAQRLAAKGHGARLSGIMKSDGRLERIRHTLQATRYSLISGAAQTVDCRSSLAWVLCHELRRSTRRSATVREMEDGPSSSAIRCRSQATASCCRQKRRW
jgi:hypothetical protein